MGSNPRLLLGVPLTRVVLRLPASCHEVSSISVLCLFCELGLGFLGFTA